MNFGHLCKSLKMKNLFFENLRMSKSSFFELCELLRPGQSMFLTVPVPLEKQVAICVYKLATCAEYRVIGDVF